MRLLKVVKAEDVAIKKDQKINERLLAALTDDKSIAVFLSNILPAYRLSDAAVDGLLELVRTAKIAAYARLQREPKRVGIDEDVIIRMEQKHADYRKVDYREPMAFVVGHETTGVSKDALKACDLMVEIPMYGVNVSLNVMVSLAIVLYRAIE